MVIWEIDGWPPLILNEQTKFYDGFTKRFFSAWVKTDADKNLGFHDMVYKIRNGVDPKLWQLNNGENTRPKSQTFFDVLGVART